MHPVVVDNACSYRYAVLSVALNARPITRSCAAMDAQSFVGRPKEQLDTPALVVDLDLLDCNIGTIAAACRAGGKAWRPHAKGFMVSAIAHAAIRAGAIGVTCATLNHAEVMAAAGIGDILIANGIVGSRGARRLADLSRRSRVTVAVDDTGQLGALDDAARDAGVRIGVVIEVEVGLRRAGVAAGPAVAELAERIVGRRNLDFRGVMGWEGRACPIAEPAAKEAAVAAATGLLVGSAEVCRNRGIPVEIVSCGGTGTFPFAARQPGVTELQAGGGVLCDVRYRDKYGVRLGCALTMMTTVTSRPTASRIICDGGKKTMSDYPVGPEPLGLAGVEAVTLAAEHITVELAEPNPSPRVGDVLEFVASYVDTSVHLHDTMFGARRGIVEVSWPVRGTWPGMQ